MIQQSQYPKEFTAGSQKDSCTAMFIAALFTIAKKLKQPQLPANEWIKKM